MDRGDVIVAILESGTICEPGSRVDVKKVTPENLLCELKKDDITCSPKNIRVSDTLSDPFVQQACVVVYCKNKNTQCEADIEVEFYDQFAKPATRTHVFLDFTAFDALTAIVLLVQLCVTVGIFYGLFGKYRPMLLEKRKAKQELDKKIKDKKKELKKKKLGKTTKKRKR